MSRTLTALLFDLDQTLYHPRTGLLEAGDRRITEVLAGHTGLPQQEADELRRRLWREYGTTARGAEIELGIAQPDLYHQCLDGLDVCQYIDPDPDLAAMLARLPAALYVATNSTAVYAGNVLRALGVEEYFQRIVDIEAMCWRPKPDPYAYQCMLQAVGQPPREVALIDDFAHNLPPAAELGIFTIYLGQGEAAADLCVQDILALPEALQRCGVVLAAPDPTSQSDA